MVDRRIGVALVLAVMTLGACDRPNDGPGIAGVDGTFLTAPLWDDGLAEVAFYQVDRTRDQYGRDTIQTFVAGTYLVKHDFDVDRQSKAVKSGIASFKFALFYRFESGSYEYRRHHVANVRQRDLSLLRYSFTGFDWCSNIYREMAVDGRGRVRAMLRTDDYGNDAWQYSLPGDAVVPLMVPTLVRALADDVRENVRFTVIGIDGDIVRAEVARVADTPEHVTYRISYERPVPSPFGEESDMSETIVIGRTPDRLVLRVEGDTGRYRATLVESIRSAYWAEDVFDRLSTVSERP